MPEVYRASTTAPVNIAVIKYWGKRDTKLNLPTNSSLSITLDQSDLSAYTTASCSPSYTTDTLILNGSAQDISLPRTQACFHELRTLRSAVESANPNLPKLSSYFIKVVSANNFPTAAGLASSAAGFAALVRAIADLYELPCSPTELSRIARQGSGSACRSLFGGYVAWEMGKEANGSDSVAVEVAPSTHWPNMRALILVASSAKKQVSSSLGMQQTVATSPLFAHRANVLVPQRMEQMKKAILARDFETFAELTMRDSNSFHATCADSYPPIFYMNDVSRAAVRVVEGLNATSGRAVAAYTFDAGPNAVIYYLLEDEHVVVGSFKSILGDKTGWEGPRGAAVEPAVVEGLEEAALALLKQGVNRVILSGIGEGPIPQDVHLIDENGEAVDRVPT